MDWSSQSINMVTSGNGSSNNQTMIHFFEEGSEIYVKFQVSQNNQNMSWSQWVMLEDLYNLTSELTTKP